MRAHTIYCSYSGVNFFQILFSICNFTHTSIYIHAYFKTQNHSSHSVANFPCQYVCTWGLPGGSVSEEYVCSVGDLRLIPGLGRSPGEGNGYPLQYSRLENSMERGDWQAIDHREGRKESDTTEWLSHVCICVSLFFQSFIYFSCFQSYCYMQCPIKHTCPHILYMVNIFVGYITIIKTARSMQRAHFKSCSHFKSYNAT